MQRRYKIASFNTGSIHHKNVSSFYRDVFQIKVLKKGTENLKCFLTFTKLIKDEMLQHQGTKFS